MSLTSADSGIDSERLQAALSAANIPALLLVLVQLTGEWRWLQPPYAPSKPRGVSDNDSGGLPEAVQAEIRIAAAQAIEAHLLGTPAALPEPTEDQLVDMLRVSMGDQEISYEYGSMIAEDLIAAGVRNPPEGTIATPAGTLPADFPKVPTGFRAIIIGAGAGGMTIAMSLKAVGIPYTIIEKNDEVGGTWYVNNYPGAGVDTPNHLYSWAGIRYDWKHYFSLQGDIQAYMETVASEAGLRDRIRFSTSVESAVYDAAAQEWVVTVSPEGGVSEELRANIVISAVGLFSSPKVPSIPGLDLFKGPWFHTARWRDDVDLSGKRVAVVGSGASAMQVVPAIADRVGHLFVYQRSPQWATPFEKFHVEVSDDARFLLQSVPLYQAWYRARLTWMFNDRAWPALQRDPEWPHPERSINKLNDRFRQAFVDYIASELDGDEELFAKTVPTYPPFGKRMLMDNGWWRTLRKDNVTLVTDGVAELTETSIVSTAAESHEVDVVVFATGFEAARFLSTYELRGRTGQSVRNIWDDDDAEAYLGTVIPDFPNFFSLYGPNLQTGHGGSYMTTAGMQTHYIMRVLAEMFENNVAVVECRPEVCEQYNREVDDAHSNMVWTHPGMDTYYRNSKGRVSVNSPFRNVDFFGWTRTKDLSDFITEPPLDESDSASR